MVGSEVTADFWLFLMAFWFSEAWQDGLWLAWRRPVMNAAMMGDTHSRLDITRFDSIVDSMEAGAGEGGGRDLVIIPPYPLACL